MNADASSRLNVSGLKRFKKFSWEQISLSRMSCVMLLIGVGWMGAARETNYNSAHYLLINLLIILD